jgi:hypothetical protein
MALMAAPAGNPADLTSEPMPHRITSCLGLPVTTREQLFACGLELVVPPPTPQGALCWELYSSLGGRVQPSSSKRWVCTDAPRLGRLGLHSSCMEAREADNSNEYLACRSYSLSGLFHCNEPQCTFNLAWERPDKCYLLPDATCSHGSHRTPPDSLLHGGV